MYEQYFFHEISKSSLEKRLEHIQAAHSTGYNLQLSIQV